jgi:hypothetical protein
MTPSSQNPRMSELKLFIQEALDAWNEERSRFHSKFPGVPDAWPPWPFIVGKDSIAERVSKEVGTAHKVKRKFLSRTKQIKYPYPEANIKGATFYDHLKDLGLLHVVSSSEIIAAIRTAWFLRRYYKVEVELRAKGHSQYGFPLEFHRKMMLENVGHLRRLIKLSSKHGVPHSWFADQRADILKRLLHEASIVYPELRRWQKTPHKLRPHSLKVEAQLQVLDALRACFAKIKQNNKLAYQLTALICSLDSDIATQKLDPTPEKVRRNAKDRRNKPKKNKSVKVNP